LKVKIKNPTKFWNELNLKFLSSEKTSEKRTILKVIILTYRDYFDEIEDLSTIPI
jgi:hypothetical protein